MRNACALPVAVAGALMPDAHVGYGLPIGGVLATDNAVIPYAVGVDIACRMKLTVLDLPGERPSPASATGSRSASRARRASAWARRSRAPRARRDGRRLARLAGDRSGCKDKAWSQLGTSGSGNHFVEFGAFTRRSTQAAGLEPGEYLALLTHSGWRGTGAQVATHYSKLARELHPELPKELKHLAWLIARRRRARNTGPR